MSTIGPIGALPLPSVIANAGAGAARATSAADAAPNTLWSVLTDEERAYFSSAAALGPVSYGANGQAADAAQGAPLGQRFDVRG